MTLPRRTERQPSGSARGDAAAAVRLDLASVLVVDDDEDAREVARIVVTGAGGAARLAATAREALQILVSDRPDVVLCDLAMPDVDGYELLRLIRTGEHGRLASAVPILAVSAYAGPTEESRAHEAGFNGFISKPYDVASLLSAIADLTARAGQPARKGQDS